MNILHFNNDMIKEVNLEKGYIIINEMDIL